MSLDITPLQNAFARLQESLNYLNSPMAANDSGLHRQFKLATIQAFECTYELAHKTIKRYLEATEPNPQTVDEMSFPTLIRTAAERGLIKHSWDVWSLYRKARGTTSHAYNEASADAVLQTMDSFAAEVEFLIVRLQNNAHD